MSATANGPSADGMDVKSELQQASAKLSAVQEAIKTHMYGQDHIVKLCLAATIANGHVLLEGEPGVGKTMLSAAFGRALGLDTKRIQFTPDLMPNDIKGIEMEKVKDGEKYLEFIKGPIFAQLLHADEINRAAPRTQSALLQGMAEKQDTSYGVTRDLPKPFIVFATQNHIEQEGTYPLPEAQLDRFVIRVDPKDIEREFERRILDGVIEGVTDEIDIEPVLESDIGGGVHELSRIQKLANHIAVPESVREYILDVTRHIRVKDPNVADKVPDYIRETFNGGASGPRAMKAILRMARAMAMIDGRTAVEIPDVQAVITPVLIHRLQHKGGRHTRPADEVLAQYAADMAP